MVRVLDWSAMIFGGLNKACLSAYGRNVEIKGTLVRAVLSEEFAETLVSGVPTVQRVTFLEMLQSEFDELEPEKGDEVVLESGVEYVILHAEPELDGGMVRVELRRRA